MRPGSPARGSARQPSPAMAAAMSGAIDLAAVKARSEAAARAAEQPAPAAGHYVTSVDEASFQTEVLDRSFQVPVLIDCAAPWAEPSQVLSPLLAMLANESGGSWVLAQIDVEANPRIAQALQLQSVPAVFAVIGGQLIPGFQGALPEPQIREFITAVLQAAEQAGVKAQTTTPAERSGQPDEQDDAPAPSDPRFTAAEQALDAGDYELAIQRYQAILDAEPANAEAKLALGQVALLQRLESLDPDVLARADAAPTDVTAGLAAADALLAGNNIQAALDRLIALVKAVPNDQREPVRARLLEYFELLGPEDPRVGPARRELARALF